MHKWIYNWVLLGMLIVIVVGIMQHPLATNDGPVHVAFSHLMLVLQQSNHPLQEQTYTIHLRPNPNLAVYFLMAELMKFFTPAFAESFIQCLCIVGPVAAGYFALHMINPKNVWLAIFILPLTLNQMLFLGLYNHAISMAAFFVVVGTYVWLRKAPSYLRAAALSGALMLTFFCHASGFLMSTAGIAVLSCVAALLSYSRRKNAWQAIKGQRYSIVALIAPLPFAALFLASGDKGPTVYGIDIFKRLFQFGKLELLSINYPIRDRFAAAALSILLIVAFAIVSTRIVLNRADLSIERRDLALGAIAATLVALLIVCVFPDQTGGGWTHFRRFEVFPYFWVLLTLGFETFSTTLIGGFVTVGTTVALILMSSMMLRQEMIRDQMAPLADIDRLVGDHCTVLPIVLESMLVDKSEYPEWMDYQPFFQAASRLELTGDRVVLFNYLARLTPYPVHFRSQFEPQANIFRWKPQQPENEIHRVDLSGFERESGMRVDYILVWGTPSKNTLEMQRQVQGAVNHFFVAYKSADGRVTLYQRQRNQSNLCVASTLTSRLAANQGSR